MLPGRGKHGKRLNPLLRLGHMLDRGRAGHRVHVLHRRLRLGRCRGACGALLFGLFFWRFFFLFKDILRFVRLIPEALAARDEDFFAIVERE